MEHIESLINSDLVEIDMETLRVYFETQATSKQKINFTKTLELISDGKFTINGSYLLLNHPHAREELKLRYHAESSNKDLYYLVIHGIKITFYWFM